MKTKLMCQLAVWLLAICSPATAQEKEKPLTNADVLKMIDDKVPEGVIVAKIQTSKVNFDTSVQTLGELSNKGVSERVLNAMLNPQAKLQSVASGGYESFRSCGD